MQVGITGPFMSRKFKASPSSTHSKKTRNFGTTEISWYGSKFSTFLSFEPTEVFWYGVHYFGDTQ